MLITSNEGKGSSLLLLGACCWAAQHIALSHSLGRALKRHLEETDGEASLCIAGGLGRAGKGFADGHH